MASLAITYEPSEVAVPVATRCNPQHQPCDTCVRWISHQRPDLPTRPCACLCHHADPIQADIDRTRLARRAVESAMREMKAKADHLAAREATLEQQRRAEREEAWV